MPTISAPGLIQFAIDLLEAGGLSRDEATLVGTSLAGANLRGHDSHGVMRLPYYLETLAQGEVFAGAQLTVLRETDAMLSVDGHWGFGQTLMQDLTLRLIDKVRKSGVAVGTLIRSSHIGRLGEYCEMAADANLVSMLMVNTHGHARRVAPPGGIAPRLGTNPLAFGAPHPAGAVVLDFGTSATAEGKVRVKKIAGEPVPDGWLIDNQGRPTNDPNQLYTNPPGSILPLGGSQAYKGFGLGLMVEIFAGALSGGVCIREKPINQNGNCVFMLVVDPEQSASRGHFENEVVCLTEFIRSCPTADACGGIVLPGDPERRLLAERTKYGVPMDDGNWQQLVAVAARLGVTRLPELLAA